MIRKLAIKYFALNYIFNLFGKEVSVLRASTPTSVSFIGAIISLFHYENNIAFALLILTMFA